jgi:hypothetical protein
MFLRTRQQRGLQYFTLGIEKLYAMRIGKYFKKKRIEKGFEIKETARLIRDNFEESLIWDFEGFDDNDIDGWSITDFKKYCSVIGVNPSDFAEVSISDMSNFSLADLVRKRREEKNFSIDDLSELIGFSSEVVEAIECNKKNVIGCLAALKEIAKELDIPLKNILEKI